MRAIKLRKPWLALSIALIASGVMSSVAVAAPEWLDDGEVIPNNVQAGVEWKGTLLLEDTAEGAAVECDITFTGIVAESLDKISKAEDSDGNPIGDKLTGTPLLCRTVHVCTIAEMWTINMFWEWFSKLELMGTTEILDEVYGLNAGLDPGFEISCTIFGIKVVDTCEGNTSARVTNVSPGVLAVFDPEPPISSEKISCSIGGANSGVIRGEETVTIDGSDTLTVG